MNKKDCTTDEKKMQESVDHWIKEIEAYLPDDIETSAKEQGAIQRKRGVTRATSLLQILLIYATSKISIKMLALCANALGISTISDTAWHKKITASVTWLTHLLNVLLSNVTSTTDASLGCRKIYLIDASCFAQEGKEKMIYRTHMSYCLNRGCMHEVKVTDYHTGEKMQHYTIEPGSIYIADAGYGKASNYEYVASQKADVIFRITPHHFNAYDRHGKKINITTFLRKSTPVVEIQCFSKNDKRMTPVRIIASRLPEDKIEEAVARKKRTSQKKQAKIKPETIEYAKWVIIATSLDHTYTKEDILALYRSRWQIELLFKRIKQKLKAHKIRAASKKYATALILLWLIVWALTEKQVYLAYKYLLEKKAADANRISIWDLCSYFYIRITTIIQNTWALLIDPSHILDFAKYFLTHKSSRTNQFFDFFFDFSSFFVA